MLTRALTGLKVIDFTQIAAGPTCTLMLADMGADVIKVEAMSGELGRGFVPRIAGESITFMSLNRNKRSIALDLKDPEHLHQCLELVATADVVVESFRPGVMDRLQLGYDALSVSHPRLIYCSISAYGQTGSWKDKPGVDGVIQAVSGLMSVTGSQGAPPCKVQVPIVDMVTGYFAALAVLGAVNQRQREGRGQYIDISMFGSAIALQQSSLASYFVDQKVPERIGSAAPYAAPNEALRCSDGWIMVAAYHPERWRALCSALNAPELETDERFADLASRITNRVILVQELELRMAIGSKAHWLQEFEAVDIICAPINDYAEVVSSLPYVEGQFSQRFDHPKAGPITMPRSPLTIPDDGQDANGSPPLLGEHTREVLENLRRGGEVPS
jgi:crotonobetainyl-CoA:carnitine CoA-transferase CaiB-like acyl-CoA transferase